jgi:membrane protein insertase Oxa1/YidC/SpoIIIJ
MINRLSVNYDIHPGILTDGFLWFKDLTAPDPYGILPVIAGGISVMNML